VRFCGTGRDAWYTLDAVLKKNDFQWGPLPLGLRCIVEGRGNCVIIHSPFGPSEVSGTHEYIVEFDSQGGETATLSERELWPIPDSLVETPLTRLAGLQVDDWSDFRSRDALLRSLTQLHRETAGIRALAASRIDLLAHQAFVVGTVIDDTRWRYILADEVGLGKTIEAGAIAHELVSERPEARVLVLTPGALSRQWLVEMHISFGGRDYRLADLHDANLCDWSSWSRVICSLNLATQIHGRSILTKPWDLVIVDEAHQLLWNQAQYAFVKALSALAGGILLLSAVPARERAQELLRLLQLIDVKRYAEGSLIATRFAELYREQSVIGRRLRILESRLKNPNSTLEDIRGVALRLIETPILAGDSVLSDMLQIILATGEREGVVRLATELREDVVSRYRFSRRILKNRRSQLLDQGLLNSVERKLQVEWYEPKRLEAGAHESLILILNGLLERQAPADALHVLFRKAVPSLCDPVALMQVAKELRAAGRQNIEPEEDLDPSAALDYAEHETLLRQACAVLARYLDVYLIDRLEAFAAGWLESETVTPRITRLLESLEELLARGFQKVLVFAGTPFAAELVVGELQRCLGESVIAQFRYGQTDDEKETQVTRFRRDLACRILVSDESGGEGRNFQFATAVVHYDLPWSVGAVEQRIGRLDRIGRNEPVLSVVIAAQGSIEGAWVRCLNEGFEVFARSISGLEFVLRDTEERFIEQAIRGGPDDIEEMIKEVRVINDRERASDDADALTDLASFDRGRRYSLKRDHNADALLGESFPGYMRTIGVRDAARKVTDRHDLNLKIWRLRPEDVTQVKLPGIHRNPNEQIQEHFGTFLRSVARDRPDLEFFSTGHALFEAVCSVARTNVKGKTFAVALKARSLPSGLYLLTTWAIRPGSGQKEHGHLGRAERHLYGRYVRVLIDIATDEVVARAIINRLEATLLFDHAAVTDLRSKVIKMMERSLQSWRRRVVELTQVARDQAGRENREIFAGDDLHFEESVAHDVERLHQRGLEEDVEQIDVMDACRVAVQNPSVELDSVGIIQVVDSDIDVPAHA
jgi:ATP-dependent helicase HepA